MSKCLKMINIGGDPNDISYRYKMPSIQVKIEGKGNGVKTRLINLDDIAKSLDRDPITILKWFGYEIGAQTTAKTYVINGRLECNKLQDILSKFIKIYVLCKSCGNPETNLSNRKNKLYASCKACGFTSSMGGYKLDSYILQHCQKDINDISKSDKKTKIHVEKMDNNIWSLDMSDEAVRTRKSQHSNHLQGLVLDKDTYRLERAFSKWIKDNIEAKPDIVLDKIKEVLEENNIDLRSILQILLPYFHNKLSKDIEVLSILTYIINNDIDKQDALLIFIEQCVHLDKSLLQDFRLCAILQFLIESETLYEDSFIKWFKSNQSNYISDQLYKDIKMNIKPLYDALQDEDVEINKDLKEDKIQDKVLEDEIDML